MPCAVRALQCTAAFDDFLPAGTCSFFYVLRLNTRTVYCEISTNSGSSYPISSKLKLIQEIQSLKSSLKEIKKRLGFQHLFNI
jgi:hypothetical protein